MFIYSNFCFRMSRPFVNAVLFFKNDEIPFDSSIENSFGIFENVLKFYSYMLRNSIENSNLTKTEQPLFYNYLIFNGTNLKKILDLYDSLCLTKMRQNTLMNLRVNAFMQGKELIQSKFSSCSAKFVEYGIMARGCFWWM